MNNVHGFLRLLIDSRSDGGASFVLPLPEDAGGRLGAQDEPPIILLILTVSSLVGVLQERVAEGATARLEEFAAQEVTVVRSGDVGKVDASELLSWNVVLVGGGQKVLAVLRAGSVDVGCFVVH